MGGKNAIIVDDDADLDEAVLGVVQSAFGYPGQKCSACSRVIVLDTIYDTFVERLVQAARSLPSRTGGRPGHERRPRDRRRVAKTHPQLHRTGPSEAAQCWRVDVGPLADEGFYVGPHIFADVPRRARLAQEEIFGPVLAVIRAKNLDEAFAIANGTDYALTGGFSPAVRPI